MKTFLKTALCIVLGTNSFNLPAQTDTASMIEHTTDSRGQKKESSSSLIRNFSPKPNDYKEVNIMESFHQVEVRGDVMVILTNGPADKLWLNGNMADLDRVQTSVKNERLIVNADMKRRKSKVTLSIPVATVASLIINGDIEVYSSGTIKTNDLEILLNGTSLVSVKYLGGLKVLAGESCELIDIKDYKRYFR
jgi:hypothetical protein